MPHRAGLHWSRWQARSFACWMFTDWKQNSLCHKTCYYCSWHQWSLHLSSEKAEAVSWSESNYPSKAVVSPFYTYVSISLRFHDTFLDQSGYFYLFQVILIDLSILFTSIYLNNNTLKIIIDFETRYFCSYTKGSPIHYFLLIDKCPHRKILPKLKSSSKKCSKSILRQMMLSLWNQIRTKSHPQDSLSKTMIKLMIKAILKMMYPLLSPKNPSKREELPLPINKLTITKNSKIKSFKSKKNLKPNKKSRTTILSTTKNWEKNSKKPLGSKMMKNSLISSKKWKFKEWKWKNSKNFSNQRK